MKPLKILYAEDEPDIRLIATKSMQSIGNFEVRACPSGEAALAALADFTPDLLLLDVMMPGMNGPELLQKLRVHSVTAATPVVFMTAKVQTSEVGDYHSLGAIGVIPKPFDPLTLARQIHDLWERHA